MEESPTALRPHPHASAYYGFAAIAIAGTFLLMALPALQLANTLQQSHFKGFGKDDLPWVRYGGYAGAGTVIFLCLAAAGIAIAGIRAARRTGEPAVLSLAGLLLALFAAPLWAASAVAWHAIPWGWMLP